MPPRDFPLLSVDFPSYTWDWMPVRTAPISAEDYLTFAQQDLKDGKDSRNLVNALSNTKRSLHLRLEDLCLGFGSKDLRNLRSFPALVNHVRDCGLVAPRVLERLNTQRNATEHEYSLPVEADVENFIDIVQLFLAATERWVLRRPSDIEFSMKDPDNHTGIRSIRFIFKWKEGKVAVMPLHFSRKQPLSSEIQSYCYPSDEFLSCVRFAVEHAT